MGRSSRGVRTLCACEGENEKDSRVSLLSNVLRVVSGALFIADRESSSREERLRSTISEDGMKGAIMAVLTVQINHYTGSR